MITKELLDYIQAELSKGTPLGTIKNRLLTQGWLPVDVEEATIKLGIAPVAQPAPAPIQAVPSMGASTNAAPIQMSQPTPLQSPSQFKPIQPIQAQPMSAPVQQPATPAQPTTFSPDAFAQAQNKIEAQTPPPTIVQPVTAPTMQQTPPPQTMQSAPVSQPVTPVTTPLQPTQATTTYEQPINAMPEKKSHKKLWLGLILILVLVAAGGAGAYAYFTGYFVNLDKVSTEAFEASRAAKTGTSDMTLTVTMPKNETSLSMQTGSLTVKGTYDFTDENAPKFMAKLLVNIESMTGEAELRLTNKVLYGELTNISPAVGMFLPVDQFMNKWFSFDYGAAIAPTGILSPLTLPESTGPVALRNLTEEQRAHIVEMANNVHFITIVKKLPQEKINDVQSYHFTFDLDRAAITKYATDLADYIHSVGKDDSYLSSFDLTEMTTELSYIKNFKGEAWIGVKDHLPTKFSISLDAQKDGDTSPIASVKFVSLFRDWNKSVTIEVPQNAMPIESVLAPIFGEAKSKAESAKIQATFSMMRATGALYQSDKGTYSGFCKSPETTKAIAEMISPTVTANDITCKDGNAYFIITSKLPTGTYLCVDSEDNMTDVAGPQKGTVCVSEVR